MMQAEADKLTPGSLYIIGFAQARSPHAGLIIPSSASSGCLVHIRIDRDTSPFWVYQSRRQAIAGDMFCTTLLKLRDVADGAITVDQLKACAELVEVPQNDEFGECVPWVLRVVEKLGEEGRLNVRDVEALGKEFEEFAVGNKAFARRATFPNVGVSQFCA
ncbi:hypothetical protein FPV67DRAFT_773038 [Lyophyllum atratum]|nr:hypothetical protein FPV67DRAFT_773038 [Lyophyllum atratum]